MIRNGSSPGRHIRVSTMLLLFCLSMLYAVAQDAGGTRTIEGRITDSKGAPLSGVTVQVKGTSTGTVSDKDGLYKVRAADTATIVFSFVGFTTKELAAKGLNSIDVTLEDENKTLNDVVVVGYGTQKKVNVIGSVVTLGSKEITAAPVSNVTNALAGRLPGAVVQQSNGEPGKDGASILIRGQGTLGNSEPLVVIDGVLGRDINSVNANDVESISILKDASAAIYGARAANGVILITTKKGRAGTPVTVNYSFFQGFLSPTKLPKMADAATYAEMIREVQTYAGVDESNMKYSEADIDKYRSGAYPWTHPNTNWFNAALAGHSLSSNHNVSVSGSTQAINYYVSFGAQQDGGIFKNSATNYNRYNIKATFDAKVNEYLTLGLDLNGIQENRDYPSTTAEFTFDGAVKSLPTSPAYYPNGLPGPDIAYGQNPVVTATSQTGFDESKRYRLNTIISANLKIPYVTGLTAQGYYAYDVNVGQRKLFQTPWTLYQLDDAAYLAAGNTGVEDGSAFLVGSLKGVTEPWLRNYYDDARNKTLNLKLDYTKSFGKHNVNAFAAYESMDYQEKGTNAYRRYFVSDQLPYLFAGGDNEKDNGEYVTLDARKNYFGRLSYNYNETYLLQFSFRRDGSIRFSKESGRWGNFPSVLAGWNISNEKFWQDHIKFVDFFKLKASWGKLGNDLVDPFQYLSSYAVSTGAVLGSGRTYYSGLALDGAPNPYITWEVATVWNAGFESFLFNRKLSLNADFFLQRRNNILVQRNASVPNYTGLVLPDENFGIVENRGVEVALGYTGRSRDFSYTINGNFAYARNKIIDFDEPARQVPWQVLTGHPQGTELVYKAIGIFKNEEEISKTPHVGGARPGDIIIEDYDGDGEITANDRILNQKSVNPEITYGFSINLQYKNWALSGLVQGSANAMRRMYYELQGFAGNYFEYDANGRWTPDNINASKPRAFDRNDAYWRSNYVTTYSYQSASYARLKNIQLSYTLPAAMLKPILLKSAQVYVSGQNLFLLYSGNKYVDPEMGGIRTGNASKDYSGSGFTLYPVMKTYAVGVRITL